MVADPVGLVDKNHGKRSMPRDWKKYDEFRRLDDMLVLCQKVS